MIVLRKASERGRAHYGWLASWHSFSFAEYYDPAHVRFASLRVINEDIVPPGSGISHSEFNTDPESTDRS